MSRTEPHSLTVTVDVPVGYRLVGYREPNEGEEYLSVCERGTRIYQGPGLVHSPRFIIEKVVTYREPVMPDDYGKQIQVRDYSEDGWAPAQLCAIRKQTMFRFVTETTAYKCARIKVED